MEFFQVLSFFCHQPITIIILSIYKTWVLYMRCFVNEIVSVIYVCVSLMIKSSQVKLPLIKTRNNRTSIASW